MRWVSTGEGEPGSLLERCKERVDALGLPRGKLTIPMLCDHLSERRGRPILRVAIPLSEDGANGVWIATDTVDYVGFEQRLTPVHQHQVILHELGHLICDHEKVPEMSPEASRLLLPSLNPELVRRLLNREHSQTEAEQEAELVGSLIGRRINTWTVEDYSPISPEARELVARLAVLDHPRYWGRYE